MKKLFLWILGTLIAALFLPIVGALVHDRLTAVSHVEYRVVDMGSLLSIPQGMENRLQVTFDGKPYKNIRFARLELYNRTTKSLGDLPVKIESTGGSVHLLNEMLLYTTDQDKGRFVWVKRDPADLEIIAKGFNASLSGEPGLILNLYFDDGQLPTVFPVTYTAGVDFVSYDYSKSMFFSFDFVLATVCVLILMTLAVVFGLILRWQRKLYLHFQVYRRTFLS